MKNKNNPLLQDRSFRWLLGGGAISVLGDQFTMIALPWLVLQMTGNALTLGLVIALMSVPRAVLILFGGALADRYSPKQVLMLTKYANMVLLACWPCWSCPATRRWRWSRRLRWRSASPRPSASRPAPRSCRTWSRPGTSPPPTAC
ncbi:MAG: hypothetical protein ACXWC4_12660 [Telluria sp.]